MKLESQYHINLLQWYTQHIFIRLIWYQRNGLSSISLQTQVHSRSIVYLEQCNLFHNTAELLIRVRFHMQCQILYVHFMD